MSIINDHLYAVLNTQYASRDAKIQSTNSYVRIYKLFMQNKANVRNDKMSANTFTTKNYEENDDFRHEKTKPKQTQFNPIQSQ